MKFKNHLLTTLTAVTLLTVLGMSVVGCKEDIDTSNRYTFTGNTVASYLEEHSDVFSSFITILKRGGKFNLM